MVPINQKDIEYSFDIIIYTEDMAIINFRMSRLILSTNEMQNINGMFQISLDNNSLCNYFKQWRFTKYI